MICRRFFPPKKSDSESEDDDGEHSNVGTRAVDSVSAAVSVGGAVGGHARQETEESESTEQKDNTTNATSSGEGTSED